jgi:hypothetical protein
MAPEWSRSRSELFFQSFDGLIMAATHSAKGALFTAEKPRVWSTERLDNWEFRKNYSVASDGSRVAALIRHIPPGQHPERLVTVVSMPWTNSIASHPTGGRRPSLPGGCRLQGGTEGCPTRAVASPADDCAFVQPPAVWCQRYLSELERISITSRAARARRPGRASPRVPSATSAARSGAEDEKTDRLHNASRQPS